MASDTPPDDDRDAEVDPWADIVADGLTDDGDQGAFDFADLDVRPVEPVGEPLAALPPDHVADDHVADDHVADDAAAGADDVFAAATGDSTALADEVFAELIGGDDPDEPAGENRVAAGGSGDAADDDALADSAADAAAPPPSLSVFAPDDAAGWDTSATDSDAFAAGVLDEMPPVAAAVTDDAGAADHEAFGWATLDPADAETGEAAADDPAWGDVVSETTADESGSEEGMPAFATDGAEMAVGAVAGAAAVATGADAARRAPRRPARAKGGSGKGGLGQFVGIVLGGALSIPIVLGILIGTMWMGRPDPIGMRRWLPGASFLLPPARQARGGGGQQARDLDSLSTAAGNPAGDAVDQASDTPPPADPGEPASAFAAVAPAAALAGGAAATAVPVDAGADGVDPAGSLPPADPLAALPVPAVPDLDALAAVAPMPPEPEPEPLDLATLDAAVEQAAAAGLILDGADADDPDRRRHMVAWYRSLSRVAEELTAVEAVAVESGRPFEEAAVRLDPLMDGLAPDGPLGGDLVRLARNWLSYSRRDTDGVVLPVTFQSARPVGPYWCSKVVIEDAGGEPRELDVVSRQRPFLELGERCVVTGVLFDGGTIWAADVRSTDAPPAVPDLGDAAAPERPVTDLPAVPPAADAPSPPAPAGDAPPRRAPGEVPDTEVPEIPVPDIGVPAPPAPPPSPPAPSAAGPDTPASDDF